MLNRPENHPRMVGKTIVRPCSWYRKDILATHWKQEDVIFKRELGVEYESYSTFGHDPNAWTLLADTDPSRRRWRKITTFSLGDKLMEKIENDYPITEKQLKGLK